MPQVAEPIQGGISPEPLQTMLGQGVVVAPRQAPTPHETRAPRDAHAPARHRTR